METMEAFQKLKNKTIIWFINTTSVDLSVLLLISLRQNSQQKQCKEDRLDFGWVWSIMVGSFGNRRLMQLVTLHLQFGSRADGCSRQLCLLFMQSRMGLLISVVPILDHTKLMTNANHHSSQNQWRQHARYLCVHASSVLFTIAKI